MNAIRNMEQVRSALTFRRVFPFAFFSMVFALAVRQCALLDPDLWWHLQTGQEIFLKRSIPYVDIFSFTKAGSEWVTHEWLSEVLIYLIYRAGGWGALVAIFSGLVTSALVITYRRCEGKPYVAAIAILLAAASASPLVGIRPQMITLLLASIFLALLSAYAKDGNLRKLWWMVPMMLLWANLHAGFALGLALIVLYMISLVLDRSFDRSKKLGWILVGCVAAVPINPNGFRLFTYPIETLLSPSMAAYIEEWASPDFHQLMFLPFAVMLLLVLAALALSNKQATLGEVFLLSVTSLGALRSTRHIPIFCLVAAPILARHLWQIIADRGWAKRFNTLDSSPTPAEMAVSLLLIVAPLFMAAFPIWHFIKNQKTYEARKYPVAATDFLSARRLPGPIYNKYGWGGYLIRRLHPEYQVYIDGRADVYGDSFMAETLNAYDGLPGWREPLDRRAIRTVLIAPDAPLASLLRNDREWEVSYEDQQAVIFIRSETAKLVR